MSEIRNVDQYTILFDGRPTVLRFDAGTDNQILSVFSDDNKKIVEMLVIDDWHKMNDKEFKEMIVTPALCNLDGATFPERFERFSKALKNEMKRMKDLQNG